MTASLESALTERVVEARGAPPLTYQPSLALLESDNSRDSLCQRAYSQIRKSLISSTLRPGHKLILRPLAAELKLSPTPVREALLRLVSEQALVLDERGSAVVPVMTLPGFHELAQMRGDLEARAAQRVVEIADDARIDELGQINDRCIECYRIGEASQALEANVLFHRTICKVGNSAMILRMLEGLWMRLGPVYALQADDTRPEPAPDDHPHERMLIAFRARDIAAARIAAMADVDYGSRLIEHQLATS